MFKNNIKCDIYVGKGAGKKLLEDIDTAQRCIKIISPFLSPFLIKKLIELHRKDIDIQLITTDDIEDYHGDRERNIHKLILQKRNLDERALRKRKALITSKKMLSYTLLGLFFLMVWLGYVKRSTGAVYILFPILITVLAQRWYRSKIRGKRIFDYSYGQLFPFKVYLSPQKYHYEGTYIHSKIYIIDDTIAYLGSLNFTGGGTQKNHETRVRTTDSGALDQLIGEFDDLFHSTEFPERDIASWGHYLYGEPIN